VERIAEQISSEGELIVTRTGAKANPLIREETQLRSFICRTLARLGITNEPVGKVGRPPGWSA
jgi:hypothetical protein